MLWGNYMCAIVLTITGIAKIIQQINMFGGLKLGIDGDVITNGWIWNVNNELISLVSQLNDTIWMFCAIILPMLESGYLTWKKLDPHGLIIVIEDNKMAKRGYEQVPDQIEISGNPA